MPSLKNKRILLGVSGGIAAYKIPELVRLFIKNGAEVQVIMSPSAHRFVTAETLATVSKRPVFTEFFEEKYRESMKTTTHRWIPDIFAIKKQKFWNVDELCYKAQFLLDRRAISIRIIQDYSII